MGVLAMSKHTVPPSKKTDRGKVDFFVRAVDRRRLRVVVEIPEYNARLIFTADPERSRKVKIWQAKDRQLIDPKVEESTLHVSQEVYSYVARVAASILGQRLNRGLNF